jgi:hypothetical protein
VNAIPTDEKKKSVIKKIEDLYLFLKAIYILTILSQ